MKKIEECVEIICSKGCQSVRSDILMLEDGQSLPETEGLSAEECLILIKELKSIMAVYGDSCRIDQ